MIWCLQGWLLFRNRQCVNIRYDIPQCCFLTNPLSWWAAQKDLKIITHFPDWLTTTSENLWEITQRLCLKWMQWNRLNGFVHSLLQINKKKKKPRLLKLQELQPLSCETKSWKRLQWFVTEESYLQDGGGARRRGHRTWNRRKEKKKKKTRVSVNRDIWQLLRNQVVQVHTTTSLHELQ